MSDGRFKRLVERVGRALVSEGGVKDGWAARSDGGRDGAAL